MSMGSHELETAVDAVLSSLECLDIEDRWAVLEEALSRSTKTPKLVIKQDQDPSPARDYDHLGHMVCWHKKYSLGDDLKELVAKHTLSFGRCRLHQRLLQ